MMEFETHLTKMMEERTMNESIPISMNYFKNNEI